MSVNNLRTLCNSLGFSCYTPDRSRLLTVSELNNIISRANRSSSSQNISQADFINELYNIFRQYPTVFPDAYFRFLKANLEESLNKGTYIYKKGTLLTWKQYQRPVQVTVDSDVGTRTINAGDFLLDKMVSKFQGNGNGARVMEEFLKIVGKKHCYLKVSQSNTVAINFYKKYGFRIIDRLHFGNIPGVLMFR